MQLASLLFKWAVPVQNMTVTGLKKSFTYMYFKCSYQLYKWHTLPATFQSLQVTNQPHLVSISFPNSWGLHLLDYGELIGWWCGGRMKKMNKSSHSSYGPNWTRSKNAQEESIKDKIVKKNLEEMHSPIPSSNSRDGKEWVTEVKRFKMWLSAMTLNWQFLI